MCNPEDFPGPLENSPSNTPDLDDYPRKSRRTTGKEQKYADLLDDLLPSMEKMVKGGLSVSINLNDGWIPIEFRITEEGPQIIFRNVAEVCSFFRYYERGKG